MDGETEDDMLSNWLWHSGVCIPVRGSRGGLFFRMDLKKLIEG